MNNLDHCLDVVVVLKSCQPLCHICKWISRKALGIEAWFQRTTNRKWLTGNGMVTWPIKSRDPERSNSRPQYAYSPISRAAGDAI